MDLLACLDCVNSCLWGNLASMIIGLIGLLLGAIPGGVGGAAVGGTAAGAAGVAAGGTGGVGAAAGAGALIGEIFNIIFGCGIPGSFINSILVFPSLCESLFNNLIWICGGPVVIRAAYMDGCLREFLDACFDLIRHLMGG